LIDPALLRPLQPPPSFSAIVADGLAPSGGLDATLASRQDELVNDPTAGVDAVHAGTIDVASDIVTTEIATAPSSPAPALLATGDQSSQIRESMAPFLPPPETPIDAPFTDPPQPPDGVVTPREPSPKQPV
jgi:hypothetical protein